MKRYMLFAGKLHHPNGGMEDFIASFEDSEIPSTKGLADLKQGLVEWFAVYDLEQERYISCGQIG